MATASSGPAEKPATIVTPLSPSIGLELAGVDLCTLDAGLHNMIRDLWQLGAALLFRDQAQAGLSALAAALSGSAAPPIAPSSLLISTAEAQWHHYGACDVVPPAAVVIAVGDWPDLPALTLAGTEAAADELRLAAPELFAKIAGLRLAHDCDGAHTHPACHRHPLTGETCLYPAPPEPSANDTAALLHEHATKARFCYSHEWSPGDILAFDPRAAMSRWQAPRTSSRALHCVVPGAGPLVPTDTWPPAFV